MVKTKKTHAEEDVWIQPPRENLRIMSSARESVLNGK